MTFIDILKSAVGNTFRNKVRTGLTVIAIFIGAFTLTLTTAIGAGVNQYIDSQVSSIGAGNMLTVTVATDSNAQDDGPAAYDPEKNSSGTSGFELLSDADLAELEAIDGIGKVEPVSTVTPDYIEYDANGKFELSVNPAASIGDVDLAAGNQLDAESADFEVLLPGTYVDALGFIDAEAAVGETVTVAITDYTGVQHEVDARVRGIQNDSLFATGAGFNDAFRGELNTLQTTGLPEGVATGYFAAMAYYASDATAEEIDALKADLLDQGFSAQTVEDQIGAIQTVIDGIIGVLNAFAVIALIAAGFGIINTLLMSVQERTREIGLMKAMGMGGGKIFALFSFEAIFIGFLGSAIGALAAILLGTGISTLLANTVLSALPGLTIMVFTPASVAIIVAIVMLIAFLAGTLPARRAAQQNPIDALRYE